MTDLFVPHNLFDPDLVFKYGIEHESDNIDDIVIGEISLVIPIEHDEWFNDLNCKYIDKESVTDWSKIIVKCGVYFIKVYKDFVLVSRYGYSTEIKMWYDGRYSHNLKYIIDLQQFKYIKKIISHDLIQEIRGYV